MSKKRESKHENQKCVVVNEESNCPDITITGVAKNTVKIGLGVVIGAYILDKLTGGAISEGEKK